MVDKFALKRMMNAIRAELEKPEGRKDFEEWYLKRYGKPYKWHTVKDGGMLHETV